VRHKATKASASGLGARSRVQVLQYRTWPTNKSYAERKKRQRRRRAEKRQRNVSAVRGRYKRKRNERGWKKVVNGRKRLSGTVMRRDNIWKDKSESGKNRNEGGMKPRKHGGGRMLHSNLR
jgi:hypothetical protein